MDPLDSPRDALAKEVVQKYKTLGKDKVKEAVKIFVAAGYLRQTIQGIIKRSQTNGKIATKAPPGRKPNSRLIAKVKKTLDKNPSTSCRTGSHTLKTSKLCKGHGPEITVKQATKGKKLYEKVNNKKMVIVMDDETYVPKDPQHVPGREFYSATSRTSIPSIKDPKQERNAPESIFYHFIVKIIPYCKYCVNSFISKITLL
uniref:H15 domain-containing protein n=1 Tax=Rhabditophanes sp. KR3021 TaxID=114890 RepID=A0AC35UC14_9BILA